MTADEHMECLPSPRKKETLEQLLAVWQSSVQATHHFLNGEDITELRPFVWQALKEIPLLHTICEAGGKRVGFMGVQADRLEMLFLHPQVCGRGLGTHMLAFAVKELGVRRLDVNEQNPAALKFYLSRGFRVTARSPLDSQGKPWPILHMELKQTI